MEWKIKSTLERAGIREIPFAEYYEQIDYLKPEIILLAIILGVNKTERLILIFPTGVNSTNQFPELDYLTYRHHAFPEALIDVTQSEYIVCSLLVKM